MPRTIYFPAELNKFESSRERDKKEFVNLVRRIKYGIEKGSLLVKHVATATRSVEEMHIVALNSSWWLSIVKAPNEFFNLEGKSVINGIFNNLETFPLNNEYPPYHPDETLTKLWVPLLEYVRQQRENAKTDRWVRDGLAKRTKVTTPQSSQA